VFFILGSKVSTGLAYIFKLATLAFYFIYSTTVIFICVVVFFRLKVVLYVFFFVLYAIRIFVFLNSLAMVLVSLPMYVNVSHFCLSIVFLFCFAFVCERVCGGYLLLCNIIIFHLRKSPNIIIGDETWVRL
jgi:hypothetical protein